MKHNFKLIISVIFFVFFWGAIQAQTTVSTGGYKASGQGGTLNYSIGQVICTSNSGSQGSLSGGVQQTYLVKVVTGIKQKNVNLDIVAYPNPTVDYLNLRINELETDDISWQLFDMQGKLLDSQNDLDMQNRLDFSKYVPGTYLLLVRSGNATIKTFKIYKQK